jgi:branched-chain amino acid transport system substrate-binding protein
MLSQPRGDRARRRGRAGTRLLAVLGTAALAAAGCGGSDDGGGSGSSGAKASADCKASIGVMTVLTGAAGPQGREQLHWAQLATDQFNQENGTHFKIVEGDDQLEPAQGATVAQQFASNKDIVAIVGPESDGVVRSAGPILARAGLAMVSESATSSDLTDGTYPTFYRVIAPDSAQGGQDAQYMMDNLGVKKVFIIDDQSSYSKGIVDEVVPKLKDGGVSVQQDSVSQNNTDYSSLVSKVGDDTDVVFLPWMLAANAQQFGKQMQEQGKKAAIFGTDGVFSPSDFSIDGSFISTFSPDIANDPQHADLVKEFKKRYGQFGAFGLPAYPATNAVLTAIKSICDKGETPAPKNVNEAVKNVNVENSILGQPIRFEPNGELKNAKFYVYTIKNGKYALAPE